MKNPRLASRYAKSLLDIAVEQNALEAVLNDMKLIHQVCTQNHEFSVVLRSPVINSDKKIAILNAVFQDKIHVITKGFIALLVKKGREFFLPEMTQAFVEQYKIHKNIHSVRLTTATHINEALKQDIHNRIKASVAEGTIDLETKVDEKLIGGFVLEVGDKLFDASILRDLNDIKKQFTQNEYIPLI